MRYFSLAILLLLSLFVLIGCDLINTFAPALESTPIPTATITSPTASAEPTLGNLEYIDAVYCRVSHIDEAEYNLIRFFPNGTLIDVFVQGYSNCDEAWQKTAPYLLEEKLINFNHGEYQLSNEWIVFSLSPANSNIVIGEVKGVYSPERLLLVRQGSEEQEYLLVNKGG